MMFSVPAIVGLVAATGQIRFEDITDASGIPADAAKGAPTSHAAALAWFDVDLDGYVDLIVGQAAGPTLLFKNGGAAQTFAEATPLALAAVTNVVAIDTLTTLADGPTSAVGPIRALAMLAGQVEARLVVFTVDSLGVFTPVPVGQPARALDTIAHGDLDGDGLQELIVTQRACAAPAADLNTVFRLARTPNGFHTAGASDPYLGQGCTPVPLVTDFDDTGHPALLVATDFGAYGTPSYVMRGAAVEALLPVYGRGIAVGDDNGDRVLDYHFSSTVRDVTLRSTAEGRVAEVGPPASEWGDSGIRDKWGAAYLDADNDGELDLWATVGETTDPVSMSDPNGRDLLLSKGEEIGPSAGINTEDDDRVIALADWNHDGKMDAVVGGPGGLHLFKNTSDTGGHWVEFVVPDNPGTRYEVTSCEVTRVREWSGGAAGGAHQALVHVGLGACIQSPSVRVRYPWVGWRDIGVVPVDAISELPGLGEIWVSPRVAAPGEPVVVHSSFAGAVVADGVPVVDGLATLTAPSSPGLHTVALTLDGAVIDLAPTFTVVEATADAVNATRDVFTDPWPPRIGEPAVLYGVGSATATVESGATLDGTLLTASAPDVALIVAGRTLHLPAVARFGPLTTITSERRPSGNVARLVLADGYGAAIPSVPSDVSLVPVDPTGFAGPALPLMSMSAPWTFAAVPASALSVRLTAAEVSIVERRVAATVVSTPDAAATAFWPVIPWVRADGQDILTVGLALLDKNGQLTTPGKAFTPTASGCTAIDSEWTNTLRLFALSHWTFRFRAPVEAGRIDIAAGTLTTTAWAVPAEHAPVDLGRTELHQTAAGLELVPRDSAKRLVGSGVVTQPPFDYVGLGRYIHPIAPGDPLSVTMDGTMVLAITETGGVDKDVVSTETDTESVEFVEESQPGQGDVNLDEDLGPPAGAVEFDFTLPDIVFVTPETPASATGGCLVGTRGSAPVWGLPVGVTALLLWRRRRRTL